MRKGFSASLQHFTPLLLMKDVNGNDEYLNRMNFILFEKENDKSIQSHISYVKDINVIFNYNNNGNFKYYCDNCK